MYNLTDINTIKRVMSRHGVTFSKALGQNFIIDPEVCPEIVRQSGVTEEDGVLEIGPGVGVLTQEIAKKAKKVVALELDTRLIPVLADTLEDFSNVDVINADVMKTDLPGLFEENFKDCINIHVIANLPYYITSPIIMMLLESNLPIKAITVMVQKEAGERLCARVGSRDAGAVSVAVNYYSVAEELFFVPRESFMPSPNVDSEVIKLSVRETPAINPTDEKFFFSVVKAAFSQRRKTAANGLSSGLGMAKNKIFEALTNAGLDTNVRAEKLTTEELFALSEELYKMR
ncbi:MAG: 16S rRNA (adenine(1518)-N(6)/adenine(1519)-N(6))-dimethyltransferase RsmA [Clostridia bacterium]|nr:16S rRNA (adenine(1518)-N(6)/adenine(1519)-N(6))-dimethyltransferase RsmA [Clostridia bacterium]